MTEFLWGVVVGGAVALAGFAACMVCVLVLMRMGEWQRQKRRNG